jgi:hypothetical protein
MPFTLKHSCSLTPQQKPNPCFHPSLTHIEEYNLKIQKYSPIPYKNQILAHTHRRNEENIEFHTVHNFIHHHYTATRLWILNSFL